MPDTKGQRKRGRPPISEEVRKRPPVGFRPTPDLRHQLEESTSRNGRSLSEEILFRLEASYRGEEFREERAGGKHTQALVLLIEESSRASQPPGMSWLESPSVAMLFRAAVEEILDDVLPGALTEEPDGGLREQGKSIGHGVLAGGLAQDMQSDPRQRRARLLGHAGLLSGALFRKE